MNLQSLGSFLDTLPFPTPESPFGDKKSITENVLSLYETRMFTSLSRAKRKNHCVTSKSD